MQKFLFSMLLAVITVCAAGQKLWHKQGYSLQHPVCFASDEIIKAFVPPPPEVLKMLKSAEKKSNIIVTYRDFPTDAIKAFEFAVSIWETLIDSPVPIYIQASWLEKNRNVLGSCGPSDFEKNFNGAPHKNIYYPISLVEKIQGIELTGPDRPDMIAEFNSEINWYFGVDGNTPLMMYDFVSVVLHEIAHGLGFTGFFTTMDLTGGYSWWGWGDATSFDRLVINQHGEQLINTSNFENPSVELKSQLTSNLLYANSPVAVAADSSSFPRLFAPSNWNEGSSIYHLNEATYPPGTENTLMTHTYGRGEATHHPGPVTLGILADMGWKKMKIEHLPLKDQEIIESLNFQVNITSDYTLDPSRLYLYFSTDSFASPPDSISLLPVEPNLFESNLLIDPEITSLQYYFSAADSMNRTFTKPADAPNEYYTINFGPDDIFPTIKHEPVSFFFDTGGTLKLVAEAEDNLGIDTVYVEYAVNGVAQQPFGLSLQTGKTYTGAFPFENDLLNDKDEISYQIVAIDASRAENISKYPLDSSFSFLVEKMFDPITSYSNQFESYRNDFILEDFDIYLADGFKTNALHSPHPYPSPDEDDMEFNFITILKHPIILIEEAKMSFDEIVLVEPGNKGTGFGDFEFWDFVVVEGSKDKGKTWLPLADGYDSREHFVWEERYYSSIAEMNSTSVGSSDLYINRQINLLENGNFSAGDTILIRFRLYSDPYVHGWGWAIDNLHIQSPATASSDKLLSPGNIFTYPNPFSGSFKVVTETKEFLELLQYELYNMHGQKITSILLKNVTGSLTSEIKVDNGTPGIYLLVVKENGRQVLSKKIIHN